MPTTLLLGTPRLSDPPTALSGDGEEEVGLSVPSKLCNRLFCCSSDGVVTNQLPVEDMAESIWLLQPGPAQAQG